MKSIPVKINWTIRRDRPEILAIESAVFEFPWSEETFAKKFRLKNVIGMTAKHDDTVAGYMIYEYHRTRIHVLNFAVKDTYQGFGVGRQMIDKLKRKLSEQRRPRLTLEVRESNCDAHLFFRAMGFKATSIRHGWYDTGEDAYRFVFRYQPEMSHG